MRREGRECEEKEGKERKREETRKREEVKEGMKGGGRRKGWNEK